MIRSDASRLRTLSARIAASTADRAVARALASALARSVTCRGLRAAAVATASLLGAASAGFVPGSSALPGHRLVSATVPSACAQERELIERNSESNGEVRRWLERMAGLRSANPLQRDHSSVRNAFAEVVADCRESTVKVMVENVQVALGTVVDREGLVATKASELHSDIVCVLADGRKLPAQLVATDEGHDLALLRVAATDLHPIEWATEAPAVGMWLATPNHDRIPAAIGVLSNTPRSIASSIGYLGVGLHDSDATVVQVFPGSAADKAGLRESDRIASVNGKAVSSRTQLQSEIRRRPPGQTVELAVHRGTERVKVRVTLGDSPSVSGAERIDFQNRLGGQLSLRRVGFPSVLQHDTVLRPNECGGPLVDLDGRAVAINIARAGRVASFGVPAEVVVPLIESLKSSKLDSPTIAGRQLPAIDMTSTMNVSMP
jgi:serine protease Do